jgi:hypothetical protein
MKQLEGLGAVHLPAKCVAMLAIALTLASKSGYRWML